MSYRIEVLFTERPKSVIAVNPNTGKRDLYVLTDGDVVEVDEESTDNQQLGKRFSK